MQSMPSPADHPPTFLVTHRVPGRLRLRVPELARRPTLAPRIESVLLTLEAVQQVRCNPACASVVLYHRGPRAPARAEMAQALANVVPPRAHAAAPVAVARVSAVGKGAERGRDCLLCRIKLALVRLVVKDLWRCWRQEQGMPARRVCRQMRAEVMPPDPWDLERHDVAWRRQSLQERDTPLRPNWAQRVLHTLRLSRPALGGLARRRPARLANAVAVSDRDAQG